MATKEKTHYTIYKTTNLINNKIYIGAHKTKNPNDKYLGSGILLNQAIKKYGKENFVKEILFDFDTEKIMYKKEKEIVNENFIKDKNNYNIVIGGSRGDKLKSGEFYAKDADGNIVRITAKDEKYISGDLVGIVKNTVVVHDKDDNWFRVKKDNKKYLASEYIPTTKGSHHSDETKMKLSNMNKGIVSVKDKSGNIFQTTIDDPKYLSGELVSANKGYKPTVETRKKLSIATTGKNNPSYGKKWIYNDKTKDRKYVNKKDVDKWLDKGWKLGYKYLKDKTNMKTICNRITNKNKFVEKDKIDYWLNKGWELGQIKKVSMADKRWIHNKELHKNKMVHKDDVQKWLDIGWQTGFMKSKETKKRKPLSLERKHHLHELFSGKNSPTYGSKWMCNIKLKQNKFVKSSEVDTFVNNGWKFGYVRNNKWEEK